MTNSYTGSTGRLRGFRRAPLIIILCGVFIVVLASCTNPLSRKQSIIHMNMYSDDVFDLSALADKSYQESRWIDAARQYQQLTEQVPQDAYAWFRLGNTYAQQGLYGRAIHSYEESIERNPEQPKPWFNLSTAYLLNAQIAMRKAWGKLRPGDPARQLIEQRLDLLKELVHSRIEDSLVQTGDR